MSGAAKPVVLVLDDEKNIRTAIEIALSQEGMHVVAAHDVAAALRVLHERIVDAMIVDIRLGEVGGLEFELFVDAHGGSLGDFSAVFQWAGPRGRAQGMPSSLCVCSDRRQAGCALQ